MNNCYLIQSSSNSLIDKKINEIINENNYQGATITTYDLESDSIYNLLEDADTISFLTDKKVIISKNTKFLTAMGKLDDNEQKYLEKYLNNPNQDVLLIFTTYKLDERKKIVKEIVKKTNYINLKPTVGSIIDENFKDYKIDYKSKKLLEEYYQDDLERLITECKKLKIIFIDDKNISYDIVKEVVEKPNNNQDNLSFSLVRNMTLKDKKNAIKDYQELLNYNIESYSIIGLLESQYRLLYQIKILNDKKLSYNEIAKELNVHPFRVKKTLELVSYYTKDEIKEVLLKLSKIDYSIKNGTVDNDMTIELLILNI